MSFLDDHDAGGKVRLALPDEVISEAVYSQCRQYRYILHRRWEHMQPPKPVMFLMLNPSTATEEADDPTVRKCRYYAMRWGYNHLIVGNLMGYRATHPMLLRGIDDPVGPDNLEHLREAIVKYAPMMICAWGCLPSRLVYAESRVIDLLRELACQPHALRINVGGSPGHPLYLPMDIEPKPWITVNDAS